MGDGFGKYVKRNIFAVTGQYQAEELKGAVPTSSTDKGGFFFKNKDLRIGKNAFTVPDTLKNQEIEFGTQSVLDNVYITKDYIAFVDRKFNPFERDEVTPIFYDKLNIDVSFKPHDATHLYDTIEIKQMGSNDAPLQIHFSSSDHEVAIKAYQFITAKINESNENVELKNLVKDLLKQNLEQNQLQASQSNEMLNVLKEIRDNSLQNNDLDMKRLSKELARANKERLDPRAEILQRKLSENENDDPVLRLLEKKLDKLIDELKMVHKMQEENQQELNKAEAILTKDKELEDKGKGELTSQGKLNVEERVDEKKELIAEGEKFFAAQKQLFDQIEAGINDYKQNLEQKFENGELEPNNVASEIETIERMQSKMAEVKELYNELEQGDREQADFESQEQPQESEQTQHKTHQGKHVERKFRDAETAFLVLQASLKTLKSKDISKLPNDQQSDLIHQKWVALKQFKDRELKYIQEEENRAIKEGREFDTDRLRDLEDIAWQYQKDLEKFEEDIMNKSEPQKAEPESPRVSKEEIFEAVQKEKEAENAAKADAGNGNSRESKGSSQDRSAKNEPELE